MEIDKKDLRCGLRQMRRAVGPYYMAYMRNMRWERLNCLLACKKCCLRFWRNFGEYTESEDVGRDRISNVENFGEAVFVHRTSVAFIFADTPEGSSYWHTVANMIGEMERRET